MSRWFDAKPWSLSERGEPVAGDCSLQLVESHDGLALVVSERLGHGTTLARLEVLLVEDDWDRLVDAVKRWRASEHGGGCDDTTTTTTTDDTTTDDVAAAGTGRTPLSDLDTAELVPLLAAGAVQRAGDTMSAWLARMSRRTVHGPEDRP